MTALEPLPIIRPYQLTVEDFLMLDAAGVFEGYGKTELIEGNIVYMNALHRPHARVQGALYDALRDALKAANLPLTVFAGATAALPPHDAPEPDILLTSEPEGEGPVPLRSIALVVEVSDTTLANDLGVKQRIYARHGVPEYWVADVRGRVLHQMWSPAGEAYAEQRTVSFDDMISAATLEGIVLGPFRV